MVLFRRKKASSNQGDEVEAEIKEKKKWLHRPASERAHACTMSKSMLTLCAADLQILPSSTPHLSWTTRPLDFRDDS
jgi:hypothetical protein